MNEMPKSRLEPLLEEETLPPPAPKRPRWDRRLDARLRAWAWEVWNRPRLRRAGGAALGVLALAVAVGTYFALRPVPQPDFRTANVDVLFNYVLLTDEFNRLPVEQRLELLSQLIQRLRSIDADQSLLMAAFAAQITGEVRDQLEENVSRLAIDVFDNYARDYRPAAPPQERKEYVEQTFIEFQKTLERLAGFERNISDEERLIEGRRQAKRDLEYVQSGGMPIEDTVRMITFLNRGIGSRATGHQKIRINSMVSQMIQTLREGEVPPEEPMQRPRRSGDGQARPDPDASNPDDQPAEQATETGDEATGASAPDQDVGDEKESNPDDDADGTPDDDGP